MTTSRNHVTIHVQEPTGTRVSPDLWGLFLEDINYALDGGLNADLVRNGDFEATSADRPGWGPLTGWDPEGGADGVQVRSACPVSAANATYVRLTEGSRLTNRGYDLEGMLVREGTYRLRLAVRRAAPSAGAHASLRTAAGDVLSRVEIPAVEDEWRWVEVDLGCTATTRAALSIEVGSGAVDVDLIELRPVDPRLGRPLLFRPDLVATLRALRPAFVRFPGGCVAHGYGLDNMYHWKRTIGPREHRVPMPNTWGYHQSMAIGYHEYFLLCEELGATPMPVVAAGVCCQNVPGGPQAIPRQRMPQYVQDVLDLVEYANGGPETRWGAVRAAAGHPEPFGLRYLGIGNEDVVDAQFADRFEQLFDAVREQHPDVTVIGTLGPKPYGPDYDAGWQLARRLAVPMVDEHSYRSPRWLLQHLDRFDHYDRSGPAVYLGEWAAHSSTMRSALAEAAYMTAVERNSDVVRLSSYAPLLARVGSTQWLPDLVYFTDGEVLPSASYHVQRMMAEVRGVQVLRCATTGHRDRPQPPPRMHRLELSSPGSTTRFSEIRVGGAAHPDQLVRPEGTTHLTTDGTELELVATRTDGEEGFVIGFGGKDGETVHEVQVGGWRNESLILARRDDGIGNEVDGPHPFGGVCTAVPLRVRVTVEGARIRVWLDGVLVHDHEDDLRPWPDLVAGATSGPDGRTNITLVSLSDEERTAHLVVDGSRGTTTATVTTLAGGAPDVGRPFEACPVEPVPAGSQVSDGRAEIAVPAWSLVTVQVGPAA
ncbi:alpha-L-arabinofuranosidase C-terminal domain-containing protein [Promicromonospora sp. NPDC019610]|uniref:alpha-L-arabinofuranosidase C-terminal domain-containing protein n=1 Tax=Promicromonospora sp. NPDC019610 TaxID=3364405 RepID=UPI0037A50619